MKPGSLTTAALMLAAGVTVGCSQKDTSFEYAYPHQQRVDTQCLDSYGQSSKYHGGYRGTPLIRKTVYFDTGSSRLTPEASEMLRDAAKVIKNKSVCGSKLMIVGHTDDTGSSELNQKLADQRANAVKNTLVGYGVTNEVLMSKSLGEDMPADTNETNEGRAKNRRVTFEVR